MDFGMNNTFNIYPVEDPEVADLLNEATVILQAGADKIKELNEEVADLTDKKIIAGCEYQATIASLKKDLCEAEVDSMVDSDKHASELFSMEFRALEAEEALKALKDTVKDLVADRVQQGCDYEAQFTSLRSELSDSQATNRALRTKLDHAFAEIQDIRDRWHGRGRYATR